MHFLPLIIGSALAAPVRPAASDEWARVRDDASLCSHPGQQGQCVRFRQPGSQPAEGSGPRVLRVVASAGSEVEVQAQFSPDYATCGVLPARITPLTLRLFVSSGSVSTIGGDEPCIDPTAGSEPGPGRDPALKASRVAAVRAGSWARWPDGSLAGQVRQELWLQEEHGLFQDGDSWCATFDIGPDDGGAVSDRALDVCFQGKDLRFY